MPKFMGFLHPAWCEVDFFSIHSMTLLKQGETFQSSFASAFVFFASSNLVP